MPLVTRFAIDDESVGSGTLILTVPSDLHGDVVCVLVCCVLLLLSLVLLFQFCVVVCVC